MDNVVACGVWYALQLKCDLHYGNGTGRVSPDPTTVQIGGSRHTIRPHAQLPDPASVWVLVNVNEVLLMSADEGELNSATATTEQAPLSLLPSSSVLPHKSFQSSVQLTWTLLVSNCL